MSLKADKIYINGNIYTVDSYFSTCEAMAVAGDRFIKAGSNDEVVMCSGADTEIIDLKGCTVLPGLIDSHVHVDFIGTGKLEIDGHDKTKEEILSMVAEEYKTRTKGQWIKGSGWNNAQWTDSEFPTKEELDRVSPDIPVNLKRVCGHASWVNSKALELAGISQSTEDPVGGEFLRDRDLNLTGSVTDQAQE